LQELNKQKIETYYELDRGRSVIMPPFNGFAYLLTVYWLAFELIAWALTFGHRQFNEEYFSPINQQLQHYSVGDIITFRHGERDLRGECISKLPKADRDTDASRLRSATSVTNRTSMVQSMDSMRQNLDFEGDLVVEHRGIKYPLAESEVKGVKKRWMKRRVHRIPTSSTENRYCRYCRYNVSSDRMTIEYYLSLFEAKGQHIDPDDKAYMAELITTIDDSGIPTPLLCHLCPNCYRPFKVLAKGGPDTLDRAMYILEIVSYGVFWWAMRWVMMIVLMIPAGIVKVVIPSMKWVVSKVVGLLSGDKASDRASKSIMNTSEENDDYRLKVRQVSKSEEKQEEKIRRIDTSVDRLKETLLGEWDNDDNFEQEMEERRQERFEEQIQKMETDLAKKFAKIESLLRSQGYGQ